MKKLSSLLWWTVIFSSWAIAVRAQSATCYMLDAEGRAIDLGSLCQSSQNSSKISLPRRNIPARIQSQQEAGVEIVPIKSRRSGIPVIDVKFNDKYTFEMMLDTGASSVVITQQMAQKLRVNQIDTVWVSTPSNNHFKMPSGYVYSIGIGEIVHSNPRVITSPTLDMGLLGQSFFGNYDITIKSDVVEFRER